MRGAGHVEEKPIAAPAGPIARLAPWSGFILVADADGKAIYANKMFVAALAVLWRIFLERGGLRAWSLDFSRK
jgi:hypothetical protein